MAWTEVQGPLEQERHQNRETTGLFALSASGAHKMTGKKCIFFKLTKYI